MGKPTFNWGKEFESYLNSLSKKDAAKLLTMIERVEEFGLQDSIRKERVKRLDKNLYEIRALTNEHWLRGCYFQVKENTYYITHGFSKKSNKTPQKEINRAKTIRAIYKYTRGSDSHE